jgi:hypothetical protein
VKRASVIYPQEICSLSSRSLLTAAFPAGSTTYTVPFITPGGNLQKPPSSLVGVIITAVPASVLVQLAQPSLRSSIASEFRAGNTPAWYQTLPPPVKSYIESLQTQIAGGGVNLSATPTEASATGPDSDSNGGVSTTSSKALAAQETASLAVNFAAVMGILGLAIAL